jgi:hypothetical protein
VPPPARASRSYCSNCCWLKSEPKYSVLTNQNTALIAVASSSGGAAFCQHLRKELILFKMNICKLEVRLHIIRRLMSLELDLDNGRKQQPNLFPPRHFRPASLTWHLTADYRCRSWSSNLAISSAHWLSSLIDWRDLNERMAANIFLSLMSYIKDSHHPLLLFILAHHLGLQRPSSPTLYRDKWFFQHNIERLLRALLSTVMPGSGTNR